MRLIIGSIIHLQSIATSIIKRNRFYYGWVIAIVASLGNFFSGPGQTYFISVFINSYICDFGWDRGTVSSLYSIATLIAGLLLFLVGRLADRYGEKKMVIIVAVVLGLSCIWNSFISSLLMLFIGIFAGRITGQGAMTLLPSAIVPQWFFKKRALAISIFSLGSIIGSAVIPPLNAWLIGAWGWSYVWWLWALLLFLFFVPVTFFLLYDRPEDLGLLTDNRKAKDIKPAEHASDENERSYTLKEAMRFRSFWGMLFWQLLFPMISTGVIFHFISILGTKGLSDTEASFMLSILAIVSFPATIIAGYIFDRIKMQYAASMVCILLFLSLGVLLLSASAIAVTMFATVQGIAAGFFSVCNGVLWPNYFGTEHIGSIRGLSMTATVVGSALGPLPLGLVFDIYEDYTIALVIMMVFAFAGIFAALLSPKPRLKESTE